MRRDLMFTDDHRHLILTPEVLAAARGLLNWTRADLSRASGIAVSAIRDFEDFGFVLDVRQVGGLRAALSPKLVFSVADDFPGVARKPHVGPTRVEGAVVFGGLARRRPAL